MISLSITRVFFVVIALSYILASVNIDYNLLKAAEAGDVSRIKELLEGETRASISARNNYGVSALIFAANNGHLEAVQTLLAHGAYINDRSNNGKTSLLWAALWGHKEIVQYLVEKGANLTIVDKDGLTVVMSAVISGNVPLLQYLLDKDVDITAQNIHNATALTIARAKGSAEMERLLSPHFPPPSVSSPYLLAVFALAYHTKLAAYELYKGFSLITSGWERWKESRNLPPWFSPVSSPSLAPSPVSNMEEL